VRKRRRSKKEKYLFLGIAPKRKMICDVLKKKPPIVRGSRGEKGTAQEKRAIIADEVMTLRRWHLYSLSRSLRNAGEEGVEEREGEKKVASSEGKQL